MEDIEKEEPKFLNDAIDDILDLPKPQDKDDETVKKNVITSVITTSPSVNLQDELNKETSQSIRDDFDQARNTYKEVLDQGKDALTYLIDLAKGTDKYEYFDSISKLVKELTDAAGKMMDNQQKKLDLDQSIEPIEKSAQTINNNVFVGSTNELLEMMKAANVKKIV